ncbi:MAG: sulfate/molybdate ABC transporter ATP-binding protein [Steroidobacteraceae bacterium]
MSISVHGLTKRFGEFVALDGVDLTVQTGELTALLGPSGCGKTTLLRIIAGLETPDSGTVRFQGKDATSWPVQSRRVGFVFQHYALFRHMTVFDNVAFGLTVRRRRERPSGAAIRAKVEELLALVQLKAAARRYPAQLSGGQRQRVALARALAVEPEVLLLDEPFGALDTQVRQELRRWLRRLHDALHFTSVFVTHDQQEALELADEVVVMNRGRIEQRGTAQAVYDAPASEFVHRFLGSVNEIEPGRLVRPHDIEMRRQGDGLAGRVRSLRVVGPLVHVFVDLADAPAHSDPVFVEIGRDEQRREAFREGESVTLALRKSASYAVG